MLKTRTLAFRLETLPSYEESDGQSDDFAYYRVHGTVPERHNQDWALMVESLRNRGVLVHRLRLVSEPLSQYEAFEVQAGYKAGMRAGEDVRVVRRDSSWLGEIDDMWVYDSSVIEELNYGPGGQFLGSTLRGVDSNDAAVLAELYQVFERAQRLTD